MSTPTDRSDDELRALRARAYGPDADIHDDPVAMARLHELETLARERTPAPSVPPPQTPMDADAPRAAADTPETGGVPAPAIPGRGEVAPPAPSPAGGPPGSPAADVTPGRVDDSTPDDVRAPDDGIPDPSTEHGEHPTTRTPWWRRRLPLLWACSVVAGVLIGVGLTLGVQAMDAGGVAVLHEDPDGQWPDGLFGTPSGDHLVFEDFYGLSVVAQSMPTGPNAAPIPCVLVFRGDGDNVSFGTSGCGAGRFPAQASFVVDGGSPKALRDRFPEGTPMQFVLDGSQVRVYADDPIVVEPTP
ncbi:hypothetical protein [Microbacterium timonense]|uniref:hypothetical protein n=1 Tax=Microbacterium timonense TaxID=2086576 RepID=UPI00135C2D92|nr:hypothetical protein [Microbacterium timonense]